MVAKRKRHFVRTGSDDEIELGVRAERTYPMLELDEATYAGKRARLKCVSFINPAASNNRLNSTPQRIVLSTTKFNLEPL